MAKRTYSRYGRGIRSTSYDPTWADDDNDCKRAKCEEAEHSWSMARPRIRPSLLKKGLKFSGPTSIPQEEMDVSEKLDLPKKASVLDRVPQSSRHQILGSSQVSPRDFRIDAVRPVSPPDISDQLRNAQLPTPPADAQKHQDCDEQASSNGNESSRRHKNKLNTSQVLISRVYKPEPTTAPRKSIVGGRLSRSSNEAKTWHTNQTNSYLLQLPASVRNKIFEYTLGGNTIKIGYETYRTNFKGGEPVNSVPIFKYNYCVYNGRSNPFKAQSLYQAVVMRSYTTLNNVCRQLYEETALLPFRLNLLAFSSSNVMFNFLYQEQRLTRQQRNAITELIMPDGMIEQNVLNGMRGLKAFYLSRSVEGDSRGCYAVVREEGKEARLAFQGPFL